MLRPLLFRLDPERSHTLAIALLGWISRSPAALASLQRRAPQQTPRPSRTVMGIEFPNPVGVAAGLDKNAEAFPALAALGFGWVEVGTVTPRPQPGNPRPRLFRLRQDDGLINRMGFNNVGTAQFTANLRRLRQPGLVLGINIGKNATTPIADAAADYVAALEAVHDYADYVAVNVSSPNTQSLRELQSWQQLDHLLGTLSQRRDNLARGGRKPVPLALKIAPDLTDPEIDAICDQLLRHRIDAVIATNTTVQRPAGLGSPQRHEPGGLSGRPLRTASTEVVRKLHRRLAGAIPIIGVGGIASAADAQDKLDAGATLLQLYTSFIYQGGTVVRNILAGLAQDAQTRAN